MTVLTPATLDGVDPLSHALYYAELGWKAHPIIPGRKQPVIPDWPAAATDDPGLLRQWFSRWPDHGVGVCTGERSGFWVLDVDPRNGGDDTLAALEHDHGPLPATVEAITGGGGRHLLWAQPALELGSRLGNGTGRLGPGLDVKATGGQIVVAPTVHPDPPHRRYEWEASSLPGVTPIASAPDWLLELVVEEAPVVPEGQLEGSALDMAYAWDNYRIVCDPGALLQAHGWHSARRDRSGWVAMTRPGKATGTSCSIGKVGPGLVRIFTSSVPELEPERTYDPAQLYAALEHQGSREAADAALVAQGWGLATWPTPQANAELSAFYDYQRALKCIASPGNTSNTVVDELPPGPQPIDWPEFWTRERRADDWAIPQVVPAGRLVTVWAKRKAGKSLFVLDIAAAAATGRPIMGGAVVEPIDIIYLDLEMTEDDVEERLSDLGYGPSSDLSRFHYYLLPTLPPLDHPEGGYAVMELVRRHEAAVVIIDTMARVVQGEENSADTYRAFYRATGLLLKQAGVACVRLDHAGKLTDKGERGSSAKGDDVDLSWELQEMGAGDFLLKRSYTRISWAPETIRLRREVDPLRHVTAAGGYIKGTGPCAEHLNDLGLPLEVTVTEAIEKLRAHDLSPRTRNVVGSAIKFRKSGAERSYPQENGQENGYPQGVRPREENEENEGRKPWSQG